MNLDKSKWKKVSLGQVAFEYSKRVDNPATSGFDRFVGSANIGRFDFRVKSWEDASSVESAMKQFEKGDYLLVRRSLYGSDFRERAPRADFDGICSGDIITLKENPKMLAEGFLIGVLNSPALWKYIVANASGSITRRIKWRDLANYEFLLPPKDQQEKLAELLWAGDEVVEMESRVLNSAEELYKATREFEMLKRGINSSFSYNTKLQEYVNSGIEFVPLESLLTDIRYGTSKKGNQNKQGVPVLGIPNVINERLSLDSFNYVVLEDRELNSCKLKFGDIVIVRTNGNSEYTGRSALYDLNDGHAYASYLIKITADERRINPEFLIRYLQTRSSRSYFKRSATSTAGNYNINTETIKGIPIPSITIELQDTIVKKLRLIETSMDSISRTIEISKRTSNSLISKTFQQ